MNENDEGGIASLVKQADGTYTRKDQVMAAGAPPCYVAYDKNRELIYTANYHKGDRKSVV